MGPLQFVADYIEKARSYIYGIYAFWFTIFFSPVLFTAFFVDQDLIYKETDLLKGAYVRQQFFSFNSWESLIYPVCLLVGPFLMTWLVIWILPKTLVRAAYGEELDNQYDREYMKLGKEDELNERRSKTVQETVKVIEEEKKITQEQEQLESREVSGWRREYREFKNEPNYKKFQQTIDAVYERNGSVKEFDDYGNVINQIEASVLATSHSKGLVELDHANQGTIRFTPKGLYFVGRYTSGT